MTDAFRVAYQQNGRNDGNDAVRPGPQRYSMAYGSIGLMTQADGDGRERRIFVEIGDRRLPPRMVARRIRGDLRQPGGPVASRLQTRNRLTLIVLATMLIRGFMMARPRQAG